MVRVRGVRVRPLSRWDLISKLISKFILISFFRKKISSVNSELSNEINFAILFRSLEHAKFCGRNFAYGAL